MNTITNYDVVVIGSGHAGSEAALACARAGFPTVLLTLNLDAIAYLACNPSIGGTAKGHLVTEIDALGGEMGVNADKTTIQLRMLNLGKGPAVHSLRAQVDKLKYHEEMKRTLENQKNLDIRQAEAKTIVEENGEVKGVLTTKGEFYECKKVIVATGVYLKSRIVIGNYSEESGPSGFRGANFLTQSLIDLGFELRRFKTGTPNRVYIDSIDTKALEIQYGDENIQTFSFLTKKQPKNKAVCYLAYTNADTHQIINENIHLAPLFSGDIKGVGPRYCPSIEDKVRRFSDKERHQIFLEPEALGTKEAYVQGMSTSMPVEIQKRILKSIKGFENVKIMRDAYAIEYDCINSLDLYPTLEYKRIKGLYCAGQINGTTGYEEAAAQGLMAGINAVLSLQNKEPLILSRSDAYIGVLIDDLVTKGTNEPYRMLTSRAEFRLLLRHDNADLRLTDYGKKIGLISEERYQKFKEKKLSINSEIEYFNQTEITPTKEITNYFNEKNLPAPKGKTSLAELLRRPEISYQDIEVLTGRTLDLDPEIKEQVEINIKYQGYIEKSIKEAKKLEKESNIKIPKDIDYNKVTNLALEARAKLNKIKPITISQASRISGVNPADIQMLLIYLRSNET